MAKPELHSWVGIRCDFRYRLSWRGCLLDAAMALVLSCSVTGARDAVDGTGKAFTGYVVECKFGVSPIAAAPRLAPRLLRPCAASRRLAPPRPPASPDQTPRPDGTLKG